MKTKYLAEVTFSNGKNATAEDNNLRTLKARIARCFAGERTTWGFEAVGLTVTAYTSPCYDVWWLFISFPNT